MVFPGLQNGRAQIRRRDDVGRALQLLTLHINRGPHVLHHISWQTRSHKVSIILRKSVTCFPCEQDDGLIRTWKMFELLLDEAGSITMQQVHCADLLL